VFEHLLVSNHYDCTDGPHLSTCRGRCMLFGSTRLHNCRSAGAVSGQWAISYDVVGQPV
jgi:hypothetical protein